MYDAGNSLFLYELRQVLPVIGKMGLHVHAARMCKLRLTPGLEINTNKRDRLTDPAVQIRDQGLTREHTRLNRLAL